MNKPVAWINYVEHSDFYDLNVSGRGIPLYTHPVKEEAEQQSYQEADGCPTELAVLQRFWRKHHLVKEHFEDEPQAEELYEILQSNAELTDEEIMDEVFKAGLAVSKDTDVFLLEHDVEAFIKFAKAILRKAQEK